jgi:DNA transposition AAA+ family ATPase
MSPELLNSLDTVELKDLAARVLEYQEAKGLSDSAMLRKFAAMGSTTTYKNILNGKLGELDLEKWLTNYRAVVALIESSKDEEEEEELYADLVGPLELKRAFLETSTTKSINRFIIVQGDTGTGKTACRKALIAKFGMRFIQLEATVAWGDRPRALLCAILTALGVKEHPVAEADCMIKAIEKLGESRRGILIDEGHHMGPRCLNAIKTVINQTYSEVIVFAMKTLWNRLERAAYEECRQLTGNRLAERIRLELRERDVERILEGRLKLGKPDMKKAVEVCMIQAPLRGNLGFVREVCKRARSQADGAAVTWEIFNSAMTAEKDRR